MFWRTGVLAEKNCEISGNVIVGPAWIGVALGGYRENLRVEDNKVKGADYGIGFATGPSVGEGFIARNKISGSRKAAIAAMAGPAFVGGDLLGASGIEKKYPRLLLRDNEAS
jgi:hypothetical protein